ncbi:hypothetical protein HDZ31DRAFT_31088 [Schizophyllum fasciatum]
MGRALGQEDAPSVGAGGLEIVRISTEACATSTQCLLDGYTRAMLNSLPDLCHLATENPADSLYRISGASNPNAGLGMFARREIEMGDLILAERPLAVAPAALLDTGSSDLLECLVGSMDEEARGRLLALANCHNEDACRALGIFKTNGIGLGDLLIYGGPVQDHSYVGVFARASRTNHSCSPNAVYHFDLPSFTLQLRAIRHLEAGEEIYISYCDTLLQPTAMRQQALQSYGFRCTCTACLTSETSDARRAKIGSCVSLRMATNEIVEMSGEQMNLLELESLQLMGQYVEHALFLIVAYTALGDTANTAVYEEKARRWEIATRGEHADFRNIQLAREAGLKIAATQSSRRSD